MFALATVTMVLVSSAVSSHAESARPAEPRARVAGSAPVDVDQADTLGAIASLPATDMPITLSWVGAR